MLPQVSLSYAWSGSGAHPSGGVTGIPGHNAAQAVLSDLRC
jgi:phytoene dehydrogenase-like protein